MGSHLRSSVLVDRGFILERTHESGGLEARILAPGRQRPPATCAWDATTPPGSLLSRGREAPAPRVLAVSAPRDRGARPRSLRPLPPMARKRGLSGVSASRTLCRFSATRGSFPHAPLSLAVNNSPHVHGLRLITTRRGDHLPLSGTATRNGSRTAWRRRVRVPARSRPHHPATSGPRYVSAPLRSVKRRASRAAISPSPLLFLSLRPPVGGDRSARLTGALPPLRSAPFLPCQGNANE